MNNDFDPPTPLWVSLIDGAILIGTLLLLLILWSWMQERDAQDQPPQHQKTNSSALLAECLNGGVLIDYHTNTAYFCSRPTEIKL